MLLFNRKVYTKDRKKEMYEGGGNGGGCDGGGTTGGYGAGIGVGAIGFDVNRICLLYFVLLFVFNGTGRNFIISAQNSVMDDTLAVTSVPDLQIDSNLNQNMTIQLADIVEPTIIVAHQQYHPDQSIHVDMQHPPSMILSGRDTSTVQPSINDISGNGDGFQPNSLLPTENRHHHNHLQHQQQQQQQQHQQQRHQEQLKQQQYQQQIGKNMIVPPRQSSSTFQTQAISNGQSSFPLTSLSSPSMPSSSSLSSPLSSSSFASSYRSLQPSRSGAIKSSAAAVNSTLKSHKADAPMLNYIFDSHLATNKHHHHDRNGPHFDDAGKGENWMNVSVQEGSVGYLNCRISLLQDKTVSWVKRENNDSLQLLTVGTQTYSGDFRFTVEFQYPNNWRLRISDANKSDEGLYECQISTYPPRVIRTFFKVNAPEVTIVDEHGSSLIDVYYEVDSTIELFCIVRHITMTSSVVYWLHGMRQLNFDTTRGGISVKTNLRDDGANSTLSIAKVRNSDSGNYTCSIGPNIFYTITVHVLNGESLAELYHGVGKSSQFTVNILILVIIVVLQCCYSFGFLSNFK